MATATLAQFESGHADMVHDAEFDYYGKRLATCSSDRTIKIFDVVGEQVRFKLIIAVIKTYFFVLDSPSTIKYFINVLSSFLCAAGRPHS